MLFRETFTTLSTAITTAIHTIDDESGSGIGTVAKALKAKLEGMRAEVDGWQAGKGLPEAATGESNEDVERSQGDGGGLYKE